MWITLFYTFFLPLSVYVSRIDKHLGTIINVIYAYLFILYSVFWNSCCFHADQLLLKLPAPHRRLSRLVIRLICFREGNVYDTICYHTFVTIMPTSRILRLYSYILCWPVQSYQYISYGLCPINISLYKSPVYELSKTFYHIFIAILSHQPNIYKKILRHQNILIDIGLGSFKSQLEY